MRSSFTTCDYISHCLSSSYTPQLVEVPSRCCGWPAVAGWQNGIVAITEAGHGVPSNCVAGHPDVTHCCNSCTSCPRAVSFWCCCVGGGGSCWCHAVAAACCHGGKMPSWCCPGGKDAEPDGAAAVPSWCCWLLAAAAAAVPGCRLLAAVAACDLHGRCGGGVGGGGRGGRGLPRWLKNNDVILCCCWFISLKTSPS